MTKKPFSGEQRFGEPPAGEITPGQFIDRLEDGRLGRHLGSWMTPAIQAEVTEHYLRHAAELMPDEVLGVIDAIQLGASEYEVHFTVTRNLDDFLHHIGVSESGAGHRSIYAVNLLDIEGSGHAPREFLADRRCI